MPGDVKFLHSGVCFVLRFSLTRYPSFFWVRESELVGLD